LKKLNEIESSPYRAGTEVGAASGLINSSFFKGRGGGSDKDGANGDNVS